MFGASKILQVVLEDIYLEPLWRCIARNRMGHGFRLHCCQVNILAYADDLVLVCADKPSTEKQCRAFHLMCFVWCDRLQGKECWHLLQGVVDIAIQFGGYHVSNEEATTFRRAIDCYRQSQVNIEKCRNECEIGSFLHV